MRDKIHDANLHEMGMTRLDVAEARNFKVSKNRTEY